MDKALQLNPKFPEVFKERGRMKAESGDFYGAGIDYYQDEMQVNEIVKNMKKK